MCAVLTVPPILAQNKATKPEVMNKLPVFTCGEALTARICYKQLADCYEETRARAHGIYEVYLAAKADAQAAQNELAAQGSFSLDGEILDLRSLAAKYNGLLSDCNDLAHKYNANLHDWVAEENECNAQDARRFTQYNALVEKYNSLIRGVNPPSYYQVYRPTEPQQPVCNTTFNTTTCYWQ
jgi:hypothetical protein